MGTPHLNRKDLSLFSQLPPSRKRNDLIEAARNTIGKVSCACGCGEKIYPISKAGYTTRYVNGHGNRFSIPTHKKQEHIRERMKRYMRNYSAKARLKDLCLKRRNSRRLALIKSFGSKCGFCKKSFSGNLQEFVFIHRPGEPIFFQMSYGLSGPLRESVLLEESKKCDMVCKNCAPKIRARNVKIRGLK